MEYNPREIEQKWQNKWRNEGVYAVKTDPSRPKYYILDMFPYPSGAGLHVGHPLGYIASDIYARFKRHKGYNVLHPMGYDAFGLPAEQYAIQTGVHPAVSTAKNIAGFRRQMDNIGFSYDWDREVNTSLPDYYKWTQWIFKLLFNHYYDLAEDKARPIQELVVLFEKGGSANASAANHLDQTFTPEEWHKADAKTKAGWLMCFRLAYRKEGFVNWCEALGTVLANDEIKDGVSERGGHPVTKKSMNQWYLRTTAYARRLLDGLATVDWPESLKIMQRNWIGQSEGARIFFALQNHTEKIEVFTTRPDTLFGATFMVLAPEHELVPVITTPEQKTSVEDYQAYVESRSERDRLSEVRKITGAFTGAYATHPFTGEAIPVWIAEYVLRDYGTGAIMAVPSDDQRDQAFARHFNLPVIEVVDRSAHPDAGIQDKVGRMVNSDFLNGKEVKEAIQLAIERLESMGIGKKQVNYKLRDANFSRQRYWGEPFPVVYDEMGVAHTLSDEQLPLNLPELDDFKPTTNGEAPLSKASQWVHELPGMTRETDTMPGFAGSSWYFLRYMDPHNKDAFCSREAMEYWQDVDLYIGGAEHAVGHLLYARTWHKFLYDLNYVPGEEPFRKLINQGMIQGISAFIYASKTAVNRIFSLVEGKWNEIRLTEPSLIFLSADRIQEYPDPEVEFIRLHVPIEYVTDMGKNPHLTAESMASILKERPEWKNRLFVGSEKTWSLGSDTERSTFRMFLTNEVEKMSKSKYNVVNPDDVIGQYGADCFRMYEMFLGPIEQSKPWDTNGIDGVSKFLRKFWLLFADENGNLLLDDSPAGKDELKVLHTLIKKVNEDIPNFAFNTCVSAFMIAVNELRKMNCRKRSILEPLIVLISPFAPHMASELWDLAGKSSLLLNEPFPVHSEEYLQSDEIQYPVCINGKKKALLPIPAAMKPDQVEQSVREHAEFTKWTEGKTVKKVIIVPGKMINLVV
jgi:leucyl-tRNA synthetase